MKTRFVAIALTLVALLASPPRIAAQGTALTYQGRLNDAGAPANGLYDLTFTLFNAPSGGAAVGNSNLVNDLAISNGLFTATLDFGPSAFDGTGRWLQIAVRPGASAAAYTLVTPRQPITAVPFAITAGNVTGPVPAGQLAGSISPLNIAPGTITSAMLAPGSVTTTQLADGAVSQVKLNASGLSTNGWGDSLRGWSITTPSSQYEPPGQGLIISSLGNSTTLNTNTGDGYLQLSSNLANSNSMWLDWRGNIFAAPNNVFSNKMMVLGNSLTAVENPTLNIPNVRLGGNTNLPAALLVTRRSVRITLGDFRVSGNPIGANQLMSSNATVGGMLFSSTTPVVGAGTLETNLLRMMVPAHALTNSQDTLDLYTTASYSLTGQSKALKIYYGSSLIHDTGLAAKSNTTLTVQMKIKANADLIHQYVTGTMLWNGPGPYAFTNWSLTIAETNGVEAALRVTGTAGVTSSMTNECLEVKINPAAPYTF